jgi:protein-tyrosine phosphatase
MPTVLDWNATVDPSETVCRVREALAAGSLVVLPGDAGYVALVNPAGPGAAAQLDALSAIGGPPPGVLAWGPEDPAAFGFTVPTAARRLMSRAWPAPLTVAFPAAEGVRPPPGWTDGVWERVSSGGLVRFRCPDHPLFDAVIPALVGPVLVADTHLPTAAAAVERLGDPVGLAVAAGERPADGRPTVVRVEADRWEVAEPGAFADEELRKLAARIVLFVCTGNTCRSPMAEGLAKKLLADRLGCGVDDLPGRGLWVLSAGVAAYGGGPATPESAEAAAELGADLGGHRSRPVNPQLLAAADDVIAMTAAHAQALADRYPGLGPAARLLSPDGDLDDPIGGGLDVYRDCARAIRRHLERFIPEWVGT